jgi:Spherulation-specific family 4
LKLGGGVEDWSRKRALAGSAAISLAIVALTILLAPRSNAVRGAQPCRTTLIPAYVQPSALIDLVAGSTRPRIIVINPASGPGKHQLPSYQRAVEVVRKAGTQVLGYVPTGYGDRDPAVVKADIDRYVKWYGVDGIFLDEAAHSDDKVPLYQELSRHVRASGTDTVVINPGLVPARAYFDLADIVVTFEGPFADYARAIREMPAWVQEIPSGKIAHIAYAASSADARELDASSTGAGYVYATNGVVPNPWSSLPPYLEKQERRLADCRSSTAPSD